MASQASENVDPRAIWRLFADNYFCFLGTPSRLWIDHALYDVLGIDRRLDGDTADYIFDLVGERLADPMIVNRLAVNSSGLDV